MRRKLLLILLCVVVALLSLPRPTLAQTPDQKPHIIWGVNYYVEFWKPEQSNMLSQLPLWVVRWGGDQADSTISNGMMAYTFAGIMHKKGIDPLYQISFL